MSIIFDNVSVERTLLQEHMLIMTIKEGIVSMMVDVTQDGFRVMGEVYPNLYMENNSIYFQRDAADEVQNQTIVRMPSCQIAELAYAMLKDEREKW